jgi:hypothetical protein
MSWFVIAIAVWTTVAVALGLLIGRSVRLRDARDDLHIAPAPDFVPADWTAPTTRSL